MSKKKVGVVVEGFKKNGPKVWRFIKENHKEITGTLGALGVGEIIKNRVKKGESTKTEGKKMHHRKRRNDEYKYKILPEIDNKNRNELFQFMLEIEQFIKQIKNEEKEDFGIKKTIHEKRIKDWNDILIQIKDTIATKDYLEFINIYNNPNYQSDYFKGFEGDVEKFKKLDNNGNYDALLRYISKKTSRSIDQIKKDFSLTD